MVATKGSPVIGEYEGRRVARMLGKLFLGALQRGEGFTVSGWREGGWVTVAFTLSGGERTYPVEARVDAARLGLRDNDAKDLLLDLLGEAFSGYLHGDRSPFSGPKWEEVDLAGTPVFVRGQERMPEVEARADAILEADAAALAREAALQATPHADDDAAPAGEASS